jgi:AraC-like DNA-binding protein
VYTFDPLHYLVVAVPMPFASTTEASEEEPYLGLAISIDRTTLADLMFAIDQTRSEVAAAPRGIMTTALDGRMADAVLRLLEALASPLEARVLGPAIVREICYRALMGEQGAAMRAALTSQGQFGRIAKALRRIHADYAAELDVGALAAEANMSVPAFHVHFKSVTHCSPIQYLKSARLHQARLLMIRSNMTAQAASAQVGYESPSQFSREFKRFFGRSPGEEASAMKRLLTLKPAEAPARML